MRAHYLQHVPFEGLGSMDAWLQRAGYKITATRFFETPDLPGPEDIDFLIVMGGPMGVNDDTEYPWLTKEKQFIKQVIESGKPVLGVCLGAQLIASAMGGKVYPNPEKEIGWFPIRAVASDSVDSFQFPREIMVFHWHGDTFSLPEGAVHLAKSDACEYQAFQIGDHVMGLQFHLETTPDSAKALVANCQDELISGMYIQPADRILSASLSHYDKINALMEKVLAYLNRKR